MFYIKGYPVSNYYIPNIDDTTYLTVDEIKTANKDGTISVSPSFGSNEYISYNDMSLEEYDSDSDSDSGTSTNYVKITFNSTASVSSDLTMGICSGIVYTTTAPVNTQISGSYMSATNNGQSATWTITSSGTYYVGHPSKTITISNISDGTSYIDMSSYRSQTTYGGVTLYNVYKFIITLPSSGSYEKTMNVTDSSSSSQIV